MTKKNTQAPTNWLLNYLDFVRSSIAVGSRTGYKLFQLSDVDKINSIYEGSDDACCIERLFSSSLLAIVTMSAPRKLKICHFKQGNEICNYSYANTILAVKLNRQV